MMECLFCKKGPAQGVIVFRINAKDQPGVWACQKHVGQTDASVDPNVRQITDSLSRKRP